MFPVRGVLGLDGFTVDRRSGLHVMMVKPMVPCPLVIPKCSSVAVFIVKNGLSTAGTSRTRYFKLLPP